MKRRRCFLLLVTVFLIFSSCSKKQINDIADENMKNREIINDLYLSNEDDENITNDEYAELFIDDSKKIKYFWEIDEIFFDNINIEILAVNDIFDKRFMENYFWSLDIVKEADYNWRWGYYFNFNYNKENYYAVIPNGPPFDPWVIGYYYLDDDKIILNPTDIETYGNEIDVLFTEKLELKRVSIENSMFFTEGLAGKDKIFGAGKSIFKKSDNK